MRVLKRFKVTHFFHPVKESCPFGGARPRSRAATVPAETGLVKNFGICLSAGGAGRNVFAVRRHFALRKSLLDPADEVVGKGLGDVSHHEVTWPGISFEVDGAVNLGGLSL